MSSVGEQGLVAALTVAPVVLSIPILFLAADRGGIEGVAWVVVGAAAVTAFAMVWAAHRRCGVAAGAMARAVWPAVAGAVPAWFAARLVANALDGVPGAIALVAAATAGAAVYAALASLAEPGILRGALRQAGRMFGRRPAAAPGAH